MKDTDFDRLVASLKEARCHASGETVYSLNSLGGFSFKISEQHGAEICVTDVEVADAFDDYLTEVIDVNIDFMSFETEGTTFYISSLSTSETILTCLSAFVSQFRNEWPQYKGQKNEADW